MNPASEQILKEIVHDYESFLSLGNSVYKAAFYSLEGRGFVNMEAMGTGDLIVASRPNDDLFVIMAMYDEKIREDRLGTIRKVVFGTDIKVVSEMMKGGISHALLA